MSSEDWSSNPARPSKHGGKGFLVLCLGVASIALIAWLFLNSIAYARDATAQNRATFVMSKLREALHVYHEKKGVLPAQPASEGTPVDVAGPLFAALVSPIHAEEPNGHVFFELPYDPSISASERASKNAQGVWELLDAWGNPYRVHIDLNADGKVPNPDPKGKPAEVTAMLPGFIIYSAGRDGDYATWDDNVRSW